MNLLFIFPSPLCLLAAGQVSDLWYAVPLIVVVSLVYAATRYERMEQILSAATRTATWISGFMLLIFGVLYFVSSRL